jgi:MoaA/NifB/PqqE/SkfB family radical SAM enzyme
MSKIIDIQPRIDPEGYFEDNINIEHSLNFSLLEKIVKLKPDNNFSQEDAEIFNEIRENHKNVIKKKRILDKFMINKHEINELKFIEDKKISRYLVYRYKYRFFSKEKRVGEYPPCLQIEPTSICNFRCIMCYQSDKSFSNKSKGFMNNMSLDLYKKVIDEVEGKVEAITLASRGEPTLNKDFEKMLNYSNKKFLALKINTNASMLNENLIHAILSTDIQSIVFSVDAADKETYEKIRVNGKFEQIMKNLKLFAQIRKDHYSKSKHIVKMSGVKISKNQSINSMEKQFQELADVIAFVNYSPWESAYDNKPNDFKHACKELWTRMFVWADGKVNPCDYDYKSILSKWNAKNRSISEIWTSKEYNDLREKHLNQKRNTLEPCVRCLN